MHFNRLFKKRKIQIQNDETDSAIRKDRVMNENNRGRDQIQ